MGHGGGYEVVDWVGEWMIGVVVSGVLPSSSVGEGSSCVMEGGGGRW